MKLIAVAAAVEMIAGVVLIVTPSLFARLILNADLNAGAGALGRVGGFGLLGLGVASWPGSSGVRGLLVYNALAAIFFVDLGVRGTLVGTLLWPAAILHIVLAILLAFVFVRERRA
ncbi:MAG: hypothetical protein JOY98_09770 [Candidatus Eremiobacteraeota bacterium]|nr:hypothetical protein [Candidatus Eremiobacteraeota bacterium]MBV8722293.1 hypothetical protein [Candidatus Eremiobacteraeota bacterium]